MSKVVAATCVGGIVKVGAVPLPDAVVLSEGVASSSGVVLLDEDGQTYIPKTSPDLKTTLERLIDVLTQVKTALDQTVQGINQAASGMTILDTKPVGGTGSAPAPGAAANITAMSTAATNVATASGQIEAIKTTLTTFKGQLL